MNASLRVKNAGIKFAAFENVQHSQLQFQSEGDFQLNLPLAFNGEFTHNGHDQ